jgi:predicted amidohydrolase YtcJ
MRATERAELLISSAEVDGRRVDVAVSDGTVTGVTAPGAGPVADRVIDAGGGALIPGLHDHHIHLMAMAAARRSLVCTTSFALDLRRALAAAGPGGWVRAVGYHESIVGPIDRAWLDRIAPQHPVRVQHRSGAMWVLNSQALAAIGVVSDTGRLYGEDDLLRDRLPRQHLDLATIGQELARYGVTGVTDLTPSTRAEELDDLARLVSPSTFPISVVVTGGPELAGIDPPGLPLGPVKVVMADHALPALDDVVEAFVQARRAGRALAVHCVSAVGLVLALAAWEDVGAMAGDRIEHGAIVPVELIPVIRDLGLTVVTQPSFVAERGDTYLAEVEPDEAGDLWRCGSLLDAGIAVGGSTDAPYGSPDPWRAIRAAMERRTTSGLNIGAGERVEAEVALGMFLAPSHDPGGPPRSVRRGAPADLCLLRVPLADALRDPTSDAVAATIARGGIVTPSA